MKGLLFTIVGLVCFAAACAQTNNAASSRQQIEQAWKAYQQRTASPADSGLRPFVFLTPGKKPGVYRLPQDGMPCIVPDSSKTVRMPNLWRGKKEVPFRGQPPRIPNAARPEFLSYPTR